jgi:hypothetical protein
MTLDSWIAKPIWLRVYVGWVRTDTPKGMWIKGIGAAGIGVAVVSSLSLLVLDIWTEVAASPGNGRSDGGFFGKEAAGAGPALIVRHSRE